MSTDKTSIPIHASKEADLPPPTDDTTVNTVKKKNFPPRRAGKGHAQRRTDAFRMKKNDQFQKEVIDKRISDWKARLDGDADSCFGRVDLSTVQPPITVPINFDRAVPLLEATARETCLTLKLPLDLNQDSVFETLALGFSLQVEAKMFFANKNNAEYLPTVGSQYLFEEHTCARLDEAPLPIAAYLDHIGESEVSGQRIFPNVVSVEQSPRFSDLRARGNRWCAQLHREYDDEVYRNDEFIFRKYNIPGFPASFGYEFVIPFYDIAIPDLLLTEVIMPMPDGSYAFTPHFKEDPMRWVGTRILHRMEQVTTRQVELVDPDGNPTGQFGLVSHTEPMTRTLFTINARPAPPRVKLPEIADVMDSYIKLMSDIKAKSSGRVVPLSLRAGKGSPAQIVGVADDDGLEVWAGAARSVSDEMVKFGGVFRFGDTTHPLHDLRYCLSKTRIAYSGAIAHLAGKMRARM